MANPAMLDPGVKPFRPAAQGGLGAVDLPGFRYPCEYDAVSRNRTPVRGHTSERSAEPEVARRVENRAGGPGGSPGARGPAASHSRPRCHLGPAVDGQLTLR
jgi:hypothetical protein